MSETETSRSYLQRVLPDLAELEHLIRAALENANDSRSFYLGQAVGKAQKLVEDLRRAEEARW
jgi:hypothetical protein